MQLHGTSEPPIPNGWYRLAFSKDLAPGQVINMKAFGRDLVLFRTQEGKACVTDPHCPHLGAHLGHGGKVDGECIRCPFHGWAYDAATGKCSDIPNGDVPPKSARLRRWEIREHSEMILIWYHDRDEAPNWEIPEMPNMAGGRWTDWVESRWTFPAKIQDVCENDADINHTPVLHNFATKRPEAVANIEGPLLTWNIKVHTVPNAFGIPFIDEIMAANLVHDVTSRRYGMSVAWVTQNFHITKTKTVEAQTLATGMPIDDNMLCVRMLHRVEKSVIWPIPPIILKKYVGVFESTVEEDIIVWSNKVYRPRPTASKSDRGILQFREWSRQFYSDPEAPMRIETDDLGRPHLPVHGRSKSEPRPAQPAKVTAKVTELQN